MSSSDVPREEAEAALSARRDLGRDFEPEIVDSFLAQMDRVLDRRVAEALERRREDAEIARQQRKASSERGGQALALAIVSLALSIPLTAIMANGTELGAPGVVMVWVAIVLINVAFNLGGRFKG